MKAAKPLWHLFPNGQTEVGTGKPGYRWTPAYSDVTPTGCSQPLTRRQWQEMSRRDGAKLVFHPDKQAAQLAMRAAQS